jgi:hypothetical protein
LRQINNLTALIGDAIHKPGIAVDLGKFEVYVGWKPLPEIQFSSKRLQLLTSASSITKSISTAKH